MKKLILFAPVQLIGTLVFTLFLTSCTEVIDVEIEEEDDRVVIEGKVTNQLAPFEVRLSKTISLDSDNDFPTIDNAFVTISDNVGNIDTLFFVADGIYRTNTAKQGVIGRTYYLYVAIGTEIYVGEDVLTALAPIDSLYFIYETAGTAIGVQEDGYYAYMNTTDPPNEKNYYYYEIYRNGESVLKSNQVGVYDDRFLAPVILYSRLPGKFNSLDKLKLNYYSISEKAYNYYVGVTIQLQNDGGFFGTAPANAVNNLSNGALGFFQASSIISDSLIAP